jgi:hypothetical protein
MGIIALEHETLSPLEEYARIGAALERQLAALDRAGAHKAAAHVDAAIHQLRRDARVLRDAAAGTQSEVRGHTATMAVSACSQSEGTEPFQVVPLNATARSAR